MGTQHTIYRVETDTIKAPDIGLRLTRQHALQIDRITSKITHRLLKDQNQTHNLNRQHEKWVVEGAKIRLPQGRHPQLSHSKRHGFAGTGHSYNADSLAVLAITHNPVLTSLFEDICMAHGVQITTAALIPEDESFSLGVALSAYGLVVVDLEALGDGEWHQKHLGCRLLRSLTESYPSLPLLFIGTASQKQAILAIRADTVRFLTQPIRWHDLARVIEDSDRAWQYRAQAVGGRPCSLAL